MSEEVESPEQETQNQEAQGADSSAAAEAKGPLKLQGAFAFKKGMTQIFDEASGATIPVTVLQWEPTVVTQVKTEEKEGYSAVQIAAVPRKEKNSSAASIGHFKKAGAKTDFRHVTEVRQDLSEDIQVGEEVSLESFAVGDKVTISSQSKGRGFSGVVKRWNFGGGPAAHGSKFHRTPGAVGNRTFPGRVIPGKKFPGQFGNKVVTVKNVQIVGVLPEQRALLVKGPVPGSRNSFVKLVKQV